MSFIIQIAELEKAKVKLAQAEAKLSADRVAALVKLPSAYGYSNLNDFIKALKDADKKGTKKTKVTKASKGPKASKDSTAPKSKRAKITEEVKAQVKSLVEAGKTGQEIAKELGISQPSVQNIKKDLGMVKARAIAEVAAPLIVAEPAAV